MVGQGIKCGRGWHAPVCDGIMCSCQCHMPTQPMPIGMHEPRWALSGVEIDTRYFIYECRVPDCHREQFIRIGDQAMPSIAMHAPAQTQFILSVKFPAIRNRRKILARLIEYLRGDPW
jgi:hypothetical protein